MSFLPVILLPLAMAQQERLSTPGASIAVEDGPGAIWTNPANMGFDRDRLKGVWVEQDFLSEESTIALAATGRGTGLGLLFHADEQGNPWWSFNSSVAIPLPEDFQAGAGINWNLPEGGGNNFVSWDLALSWRPLPWLGLASVARNVGSPSVENGVVGLYGFSLAARPAGERLELGVDYEITDPIAGGGTDERHMVSGVINARPIKGVALRAKASADPSFTNFAVGGGLEFYFPHIGAGAYVADNGNKVQAYALTGPWEDRLFGQGNRVPVISIDQAYPYQPQSGLFQAAGESYLSLLERLRHAAEDSSVTGLILNVERAPFSFAQIAELRRGIDRVRAQGKPVVAYLDGAPSNAAYLLVADCDRVYLHPAGELTLIGVSSELLYFRGALDLVGVTPQYAKRDKYKSAPEQWTNTEGSAPAIEQLEALLDAFYGALVDGIAEGRGLDREQVERLIDGGPYTGPEAVAMGLVDALVYPDALEEELDAVLPKGYDIDEDFHEEPDTSGWRPTRQIALVYVDGPITGGESAAPGLLGGGNVGSATVVRALRQAKDDRAVKAVVLRVDSPGGSAFASDEIWRAVEEVKAEGKPVIVSFGGVAASGGYYVAAGADQIIAEPTTVTGSIGVYGGKFSFGELYEKVGVNYTILQRGRNAGMYAMSQPMDPIEYAAMQRMIDATYMQFKSRVADGRDMSLEEVEEVAQGRVWSGTDALEQGLVDELGDIYVAIERAKQYADIPLNANAQLVVFSGASEVSGGQQITDSVRLAIAPPLPQPMMTFSPYLNLADEHVLVLMPWHMTVR